MNKPLSKHFDTKSLVVIIITFILFAIALVTQGFTHDLFLEAGIFLVSVKLILMGYRISVTNESIKEELGDIKRILENSSCKDEAY